MFLYTQNEIREYVKVTSDYGAELYMSVGPRATYDTSATVNTVDGSRIGYRLRGMENIEKALKDVFRGIELGVKNFVIYDEGLLSLLAQLRKNNEIPGYIKLKISAHCGYSNALSVKILEDLGADSVNPVRDLTINMISEIRQMVNIPIDIHADNPKSSGGFIRFYEIPEIIKVAAPIYVKVGNSAIEKHGNNIKEEDVINIMRNIEIADEMIKKFNPEAIQSKNLIKQNELVS